MTVHITITPIGAVLGTVAALNATVWFGLALLIASHPFGGF